MKNCSGWIIGKWTLVELLIVEEAVGEMTSFLGGKAKFRSFIGGVEIVRGAAGGNRGLTWPHKIEFTDKGTPPTNMDVMQDGTTIDKWTVVHELGHAWDANYGWSLSDRLMHSTGGYYAAGGARPGRPRPAPCTDTIAPGCNILGYVYGGVPPKGADQNFNAKEDFAEAVAAFVYRNEAQAKVSAYKGTAYSYLYYPDYTKTPRARFIQFLVDHLGSP